MISGIGGLALGAVVPALVVVGAVAVVLAVGLVVLAAVADQVVQGEAVVGGDEVDARLRAAGRSPLVQIGRAERPVADLGGQVLDPLPVAAQGVPVKAIPLAPGRGEAAHLVAAHPHVPGLGDELHPRHHRIGVDDLEDGGVAIELAAPHPAQGGGQSKRKPSTCISLTQ
jgi:hypothetical protein